MFTLHITLEIQKKVSKWSGSDQEKQAIDFIPMICYIFRSDFLAHFCFDSKITQSLPQILNQQIGKLFIPTPADIITSTQFITNYHKQWNVNHFHNCLKCMGIDQSRKNVVSISYNSYFMYASDQSWIHARNFIKFSNLVT